MFCVVAYFPNYTNTLTTRKLIIIVILLIKKTPLWLHTFVQAWLPNAFIHPWPAQFKSHATGHLIVKKCQPYVTISCSETPGERNAFEFTNNGRSGADRSPAALLLRILHFLPGRLGAGANQQGCRPNQIWKHTWRRAKSRKPTLLEPVQVLILASF